MPAVRLLSLPILSYSANKIASFLPFDRILIASSSDRQEEREIESINLTENYRTGGGKCGNLPASPAVAQAKAIAPQNAHDAGKVELNLEAEGKIRIYTLEKVAELISQHPKKKIRNLANDVKTAMEKNGEIIIEGQIPGYLIFWAK